MTTRCDWVGDEPMLLAYHDREWGVPEFDDRVLWESLMLSGFQAGLSWLTILHKRQAFRKAFDNFRPEKIAHYGEKEIARLMADASIVRSKSKIGATIAGAQIFLDMQKKDDNFSDFVWSFVGHRQVLNHGPMPTQSPISARLSEALKTWVQVRRSSHCLCLDAIGRNGQRSRCELLSAQSDKGSSVGLPAQSALMTHMPRSSVTQVLSAARTCPTSCY